MLRRVERQPIAREILETISANEIGRNADIGRFLDLLTDIEGPFTILIDSPWGDGKTFFVKSVIMAIQSANPQIESPEAESSSVLDQFHNSLDGIPLLPVYYNAWQNDSFGNPIATLLASMADEFGGQYAKDSRPFKDKLASLIDAASGALGHPINATDVIETFSGESLIKSYEERRKLANGFSQLVHDSLPEIADKMVIFIDELDRCRPDFAVKLLEQTKSLFDCDNVILVLSTDSLQLSYSIQGMYGEKFDSLVYLERFYDCKFKLTPVDGVKYLERLSQVDQHYRFDNVVGEMARSHSLMMRDGNRLSMTLRKARQYIVDNGSGDTASFAMNTCVLPVLIFLERENPKLWNEVRTGADVDAVYEYGKVYESFVENINLAILKATRNGEMEITEDNRKQFVADLCAIHFIDDFDDKRRREAYDRDLAVPWGKPNTQVFRNLSF